MFQGRTLLIATKHHKEKVIAPILEQELGTVTKVLEDFDTDELGTFSGEVDRTDDALETARKKCYRAMEIGQGDLVIASEGSFGPHPSMPFVHADDEILLFIDKKNNLEIFTRILTTETNFNASEIRTKAELKEFALQAKFPSHGLIIKKSKHDFSDLKKGITNWKILTDAFDEFVHLNGSAYIETDMRAMYNPTRMEVIEKTTHKLVSKIHSTCPTCNTPGLGITGIKEGLPCNLCNMPTRSILSYIYECQQCDFSKEEKYPNQKETEDPMYCDFCNP
jgi:hypothetical protein